MKNQIDYQENESSVNSFLLLETKKPKYEIITHKDIYEEDILFGPIIQKLNASSSNKSYQKALYILSNLLSKKSLTKEILAKIVSEGISEYPCLRSIIWRSLLNYLPNNDVSKWKDVLESNKLDYENLVLDSHDQNDASAELIKKQIEKDLYRTKGEEPFFFQQSLHHPNETHYDVIRRLLFIYSINHPQIKYIQGMNELVAVIYYTFYQDITPFFIPLIESDVYHSFQKLMEEIMPLYDLHQNYEDLLVTKKIELIKEVLQYQDKELYDHLENENIPIHTFTFRWLLLFFSQELSMNEILRLWDSLLTQKNKIDFTCYLTVEILISKRRQLIDKPFEDIMVFLQHLNPNDKININYLVKCALDIRYKYRYQRSVVIMNKNNN